MALPSVQRVMSRLVNAQLKLKFLASKFKGPQSQTEPNTHLVVVEDLCHQHRIPDHAMYRAVLHAVVLHCFYSIQCIYVRDVIPDFHEEF